ncbi:MAG: hypothetical protein LH628_19410 [Microcoleus sp. CAN_BIN18]|nr:hypothetical protein [Microcoleus sp. CAN_BIN18]
MIFTFSSKFGTDEASDDRTVSPANPDSACPAGAMTAGLSASETDKVRSGPRL